MGNIATCVPQGSIFGSLLFNIFACDSFLIFDNTYFESDAMQMTKHLILSTKIHIL